MDENTKWAKSPIRITIPKDFGYADLEDAYNMATFGSVEPAQMIVSYYLLAEIKSKFRWYQRIPDTDVPYSMRFNNALIRRVRGIEDNIIEFLYEEYDEFVDWARDVR